LKLRCRKISKGSASGVALMAKTPLSLFGMVDVKTGLVVDKTHELYMKNVAGTILVFPYGRGSTVGSYVLYQLAKEGKAPKAIICLEAEPIIAVGAIIANIPMVDKPERFEFKNGQKISVDADKGEITVE